MNFYEMYGETLPKTLEKDELVEQLQKAKSGDLESKQLIVLSFLPLICYRIRVTFFHFPYEFEDMMEMGILGLLKAIECCDLSKNANFPSFATHYIEGEIYHFKRSQERHNVPTETLDSVIPNGQGTGTLLQSSRIPDLNVNIEEDYVQKEEYLELRKLLEDLPARERTIVELYFGFVDGETKTHRDIADIVQLSPCRVGSILRSTLVELKSAMERGYWSSEEVPLRKLKLERN